MEGFAYYVNIFMISEPYGGGRLLTCRLIKGGKQPAGGVRPEKRFKYAFCKEVVEIFSKHFF